MAHDASSTPRRPRCRRRSTPAPRYADARVMHRRYESMTARNGDVEDARPGRGRRASACAPSSAPGWGFFAVPDLSDAAGPRGRRAGRGDRRGERARCRAPRRRCVPGEAAVGSWASECRIDPLGVSLADKGDLLVRATATMARARRRHRRGDVPDLGHGQVVRVQRGPPHRPARPRVRGRDHGDVDRRRRDAAPLVPGGPRPVRHAGLGAGRRDRPRGPRRPGRRRVAGAAVGAAVPERRDDADPRRRADGAADPRVRRSRHRARPHPRLGGGLRRHVVARPGPARRRCSTARS